LGSAGWICAAASIVGISLYIWSATLSKMSSRLMHRSDTTDAAALEE
jgi:hypothetical protein